MTTTEGTGGQRANDREVAQALTAAQTHYREATHEATSSRQAAVKMAVAAGWTRYRIAKLWGVHPNTVKAIQDSIIGKAGKP